jgi:hypothetical protein
MSHYLSKSLLAPFGKWGLGGFISIQSSLFRTEILATAREKYLIYLQYHDVSENGWSEAFCSIIIDLAISAACILKISPLN